MSDAYADILDEMEAQMSTNLAVLPNAYRLAALSAGAAALRTPNGAERVQTVTRETLEQENAELRVEISNMRVEMAKIRRVADRRLEQLTILEDTIGNLVNTIRLHLDE